MCAYVFSLSKYMSMGTIPSPRADINGRLQ